MTRRFAVVLIVLILALAAALWCSYPPRDSYRQPPTWVR